MQVTASIVPILTIGINTPLLAADTASGLAGKIPGTDLLGPFPILQFFAALIVLFCVAIGGMVWIKGKSSNEPMSAPKTQEAAVQLFFDGPLRAIFEYLQEIRQRQLQNRMEIRDEVANLLSEHRRALSTEIDDAKVEIKAEILKALTDVNERLHDNGELLVRMDERDKNRPKR